MTESDSTRVDYYVGVGIVDEDGKRTVIPISVDRDINAGPVQISIDNGQRTALLMLELYRDRVVVGSWPEGEEWVEHMSLFADRETRCTRAPADYQPPAGLTARVATSWEGSYAHMVRNMLDVLDDGGPVEVEILANLGDGIGNVVCRGYVTEFTGDCLRFRGGLQVPEDAFSCITLID